MTSAPPPKVSVGLPVYNAQRYLATALDCLLAQTFTDFEVVVSDNASTDATPAILAEYASRDPRITIHTQPQNRGGAWNHNFVFEQSRGQLFKWYAYDDALAPTYLAALVAAFDADPELVLAFPRTIIIDDDGAQVEHYRTDLPWAAATPSQRLRNLLGPQLEDSLLHLCHPNYGLVRRDVRATTGLIRPYRSSDEVQLVELALRGPWTQVPEPLFLHRRHSQSTMLSRTPSELAGWYDPSAGSSFPLTTRRRFFAFLRAAAVAPISPSQRVRSLGVVLHWVASDRRWHVLLGEEKLRLRAAARRALKVSSPSSARS
ncbi:MAG: hypothetical protein JWM93_2636 [Frankiales bacterium]|nr:hypothetical protein [Frankiales bacterium]